MPHCGAVLDRWRGADSADSGTMAKKKKRSKRKPTTTGHAPLFLGSLGIGALEIATRAVHNRTKGQAPEVAWRNATADVLEKAASAEGEAADALTEAAETIREGRRGAQ